MVRRTYKIYFCIDDRGNGSVSLEGPDDAHEMLEEFEPRVIRTMVLSVTALLPLPEINVPAGASDGRSAETACEVNEHEVFC